MNLLTDLLKASLKFMVRLLGNFYPSCEVEHHRSSFIISYKFRLIVTITRCEECLFKLEFGGRSLHGCTPRF
ncbi:hypothetical protein CR513_06362, partial [Mucuna pruriens]